jgi:hypothetical protein
VRDAIEISLAQTVRMGFLVTFHLSRIKSARDIEHVEGGQNLPIIDAFLGTLGVTTPQTTFLLVSASSGSVHEQLNTVYVHGYWPSQVEHWIEARKWSQSYLPQSDDVTLIFFFPFGSNHNR